MAKNQNRRLTPAQLQADTDALTALQTFNDYNPSNAAYAKDAGAAKQSNMKAAQEAELAAQNALDSARDAANTAEWEFHNLMLGFKEQVIAQYGKDSDQVQSLGLKKKSEYKAPKRKTKKAA